MVLKGVFTALVTPFIEVTNDETPKVNYPCLKHLIQRQIEDGVNGIVVLGTTAEAPTLSREEQDEIIKITVSCVNGRIPVIVGTGSYSTEQTIKNTLRAQELGADMALVVTPYYNKPTNEGIFKHFEAITKACSLPLIIYNIQGRCAKNIDTPTLKRIAELKTVIGVKEASGNIEQMTEVIDVIKKVKKDFCVLSGDDALTLPLMALGGDGIISVVSNLTAKPLVKLVQAMLKGDLECAKNEHYKLLPFFKGAFIETNPIPIKEAMNMKGLNVGKYRLPLCEMSLENKHKLKQIVDEITL